MYRPDEVANNLVNILGWRQHYNPLDFTIAERLTLSDTGTYYQDINPLVTLESLRAIAPDFGAVNYASWDSGTEYVADDKVTLSDVNYKAIATSIGVSPDINPNSWELADDFSDWLEQKTKAWVLKAVRNFWDRKQAGKTARNVLEAKTLFDGAGRLADTIPNTNSLVGFEIVPIRSVGVTTQINKIGLQFSGVGDVKMYLLHSSRADTINTYTFTRTRVGGMEWFMPNEPIILPYVSSEIDAGGSWYLVYEQSELPTDVSAINKSKDWSAAPCGTCSRVESSSHKVWSQFIEFHPFKVSGGAPLAGLWDVQDNMYTYDKNYGVNLQITISCDLTDTIITQKESFQSVIGLSVAAETIRELAYNPRFKVMRQSMNLTPQTLLYELDGDSQSEKESGLVYQLAQATKALDLDMSKVSRACTKCTRKGVKFRTT